MSRRRNDILNRLSAAYTLFNKKRNQRVQGLSNLDCETLRDLVTGAHCLLTERIAITDPRDKRRLRRVAPEIRRLSKIRHTKSARNFLNETNPSLGRNLIKVLISESCRDAKEREYLLSNGKKTFYFHC